MLTLARAVVTLTATGLLVGGYFVSQAQYIAYRDSGDPSGMVDYLMRLDQSPVPILALLIVLGCVVLCCLPDLTEEPTT